MEYSSHPSTSATNDRQEPLNTNGTLTISTPVPRTTSLNDRLNTNYVDVGDDDNSITARVTRLVTNLVGNFITPRHLLVVLRILKAITFCFLILTIAADLMYIAFLEILASKEVRTIFGGRRDLIIRIYGLFLAVMALFIELDITHVIKSFYGFKGFIPRGFLLFFISAITGSHPLNDAQLQNKKNDDYLFDDDFVDVRSEIPDSAVVFQMVTSFILGVCAVTYVVFGLLCFDRFTSKAFLSTRDPLVTTAIPIPSGVQPMDVDNTRYFGS